jgi:aminoglycoside phosphotransferase (APT) family kinase protein
MRKPPLSLTAELGLAWMVAHPLGADRPRCLTHQDIGAHNMLARDGHLAAVIDWEHARMGDPAEDLAQARMMLLEDIMPWDDFVRAYVAAGGPAIACEEAAVSYYCIWTYLRHGAMNNRLWEYFISGERGDAPAAEMSSHSVDRLLLYQSRALTLALDATARRG